jgi:hypothetical protein
MKQLDYQEPKLLKNGSTLPSVQKKIVDKNRNSERLRIKLQQPLPFLYSNPIFKTRKYDLW